MWVMVGARRRKTYAPPVAFLPRLLSSSPGSENRYGFRIGPCAHALLAYLAVEANRGHRRELLAALLWPEVPHRTALANLRNVLSKLRCAIGDRAAASSSPFLLVTRDTIQFNPDGDYWLDVAEIERLIAAGETQDGRRAGDRGSVVKHLQAAVDLYHGSFLEGFSLGDSAGFEEWVLLKREQVSRTVFHALGRLAILHGECLEFEQAEECSRRQLALEPWDEQAHRNLIRLLALAGRRGAALAHYEACRRTLAQELSVEPAAETTALYASIRDGTFRSADPVHKQTPQPAFARTRSSGAASLFVAREPRVGAARKPADPSAGRRRTGRVRGGRGWKRQDGFAGRICQPGDTGARRPARGARAMQYAQWTG